MSERLKTYVHIENTFQPYYDKESWQHKALSKYYYGRRGWLDRRAQFCQLVAEYVKPGNRILELGAGPANDRTRFLSTLGEVTGLDVDPAVRKNHYCHETLVYDGLNIPCKSENFDAVVAYCVVEHIEYPLEVMCEVYRVLRGGGALVFRTPNLWHYVSLVAKSTPMCFHRFASHRARALPRVGHEPYRTFHRMNTRRACHKILKKTGFLIAHIRCIEGSPSYGLGTRLMFYPLLVWERILNSTSMLEGLRDNILCAAIAEK